MFHKAAQEQMTDKPIFRPLGDKVLVFRLDAEPEAVGAIKRPQASQEKPLEGVVMAVGRGRMNELGLLEALEVCPGDFVMFGKHAGIEIKVEGRECLVIREEELLGVLPRRKL